MRNDLVCWLDLETTGLDPCADRVLEIGMILTDYDLVEVDHFQRIVACEPARLERMDPVVKAMHRASGLLDDMPDGMLIRDAHADAVDWLASYTEKGSAPSAGFTVGFDRAFTAVHMPDLHRHMHHRMIDVSTLKILRAAWRPDVPEPGTRGMNVVIGKAHRAIPDCREALECLRELRKTWLDFSHK